MAQYQNYGTPIQTDEYGNPIRQTDEYEIPIPTTDEYGNPIHEKNQGDTGKLQRSGSSSSSSSEDDGQGGRRKKGLKENIKEKIPGLHKDDRSQATSTTAPGGYYSPEQQEHLEKKGVIENIKEKLPEQHQHH